RLLPRGARLGQAARRGAAAGAGTGTAEGMGLRRFRHHAGLGAHRPLRGGRRPGGVGVRGGHRRALGTVILLLEPSMKKPVPAEAASALIDERIKKLGDWRGKMLAKVRQLIHQADPEIVEEWKWMGTPVWSHGGIVCTGESYKSVVKMTFAKGASLDDPSGLFNSSLEGRVRRAIDFREGDKVNEKALKTLIRAAVALNTSPA